MLKGLWHILCQLNIFIFVNLAIFLLKVLFCIVMFTPRISCFPGICKPLWTYSPPSDTCIQHDVTFESWLQARSICRNRGGQLLSIRSETMNDFIGDILKTSNVSVWIGLNDIKQDGHFNWLSAPQEPSYFKWYPGDPNGYDRDDCVQIKFIAGKSTNSWSDELCHNTTSFICERKRECRKSEYGSECSDLCPENCKQDGARFCNIITGNCHNCIAGFTGAKCKTTCSENTYGENCNLSCRNNCKKVQNGSLCDKFSGTCFEGCKSGYQGSHCVEACSENTYGENCNLSCSNNCKKAKNGSLCDKFSGTCFEGCNSGYRGSHCVEACAKNTYGENCNSTCNSNCKMTKNGALCDRFFGKCLTGCTPGYQGSHCVKACVKNTYDENCNRTCSNNCKSTQNEALCERFFGKCLTGCTPGYQGSHCIEACAKNTYGENCNRTCNNCKMTKNGALCERFFGKCLTGCTPGYQGSHCIEECTPGTFGEGCERSCSLNCNATGRLCDRENGSCLYGCISEFTGARCLTAKENKESIIYLRQIGTYGFCILGFLLAFAVMLLYVGENEENDSPEGRDSFMSEEQPTRASIKRFLKIKNSCDEILAEKPENETQLETIERVESQAFTIHPNDSYLIE